jgi:hypothetical protein
MVGVPWHLIDLLVINNLMTREEAIRLTLLYLTEKDDDGSSMLDYQQMLASLTEYATCWYVDFCYQQMGGQLKQPRSEAPGFTIDKRVKHIQLISWQELYELNCTPLVY